MNVNIWRNQPNQVGARRRGIKKVDKSKGHIRRNQIRLIFEGEGKNHISCGSQQNMHSSFYNAENSRVSLEMKNSLYIYIGVIYILV